MRMSPAFFYYFYYHLFSLGHEVLAELELQATMPSTFKHPAHVPMWRGAKVAYLLIAMCLFPIAIGGFWAYGNLVNILNTITMCRDSDILMVTRIYSLAVLVISHIICSTIAFILFLMFIHLADACRRDAECLICFSQP